jgi:hypothetical protein
MKNQEYGFGLVYRFWAVILCNFLKLISNSKSI